MTNNGCEIADTSLSSELARLVRYSTAAIGGYLVAKGMADQETVELVTGIMATATPMLVAFAVARLKRRQIKQVVSALKSKKPETPSE